MKSSRTFIFRNHWNENETHCPYQNILHDKNDKEVCQLSQLEDLFDAAEVKDGDEIEIIVRKTGKRPFGARIWKLLEPHKYGPVER